MRRDETQLGGVSSARFPVSYYVKKWHGRPAREDTRKMREPHQTVIIVLGPAQPIR